MARLVGRRAMGRALFDAITLEPETAPWGSIWGADLFGLAEPAGSSGPSPGRVRGSRHVSRRSSPTRQRHWSQNPDGEGSNPSSDNSRNTSRSGGGILGRRSALRGRRPLWACGFESRPEHNACVAQSGDAAVSRAALLQVRILPQALQRGPPLTGTAGLLAGGRLSVPLSGQIWNG